MQTWSKRGCSNWLQWGAGIVLAVLLGGVCAAEPAPSFFQGRDAGIGEEAASPRKFRRDDPAWQPRLKPRGEPAGETTVVLHFPAAAEAVPVRFGMPLGQVASAANVAVFDEQGKAVRSDVFPLVNFDTCPLHWVMIATVLDAPAGGRRELTIRWGPDVERPQPATKLTATATDDGDLRVEGPTVDFTLSPRTLLSRIKSAGAGHTFAPNGCRTGVKHQGRTLCHDPGGRIFKLYDGPLYKWYRIETRVNDSAFADFKIHFEVQTWADSPYLLVRCRLINENRLSSPKLSDLELISIAGSGGDYAVSASGEGEASFAADSRIVITQRRDDWCVTADGKQSATGKDDNLGQWVRTVAGSDALTLCVPNFQGFGPGDPDLQSHLTASADGSMGLNHYAPYPADGDGTITFWATAARTFRTALCVGPASRGGAAVAAPIREPPGVKRDREFLTAEGVFQEDRVTHVYDEAALEGARYFNRSRAKRQDYPRMGRGMPPQKGEGFQHVYTDTGGMLFGEVWQYTFPPERLKLEAQYPPSGNLPTWYKPKDRVGSTTYRCGDHALAMAYSYLRTGDREVFEIFRDHPILFCDWAIAHPGGGTHYYCCWNAHVHVYSRLGGPLLCYLADGDPWLFEVSRQMADFLRLSWKDNSRPSDVQTRSTYPCRGLTWLYEVTGDSVYWNEAVDRTIWFMQTGVRPDGVVRGFADDDKRLTPLFAGYCLPGMIPVYERCGNQKLLDMLLSVGRWLLSCQGKAEEGINSGVWVRDTLIWNTKNLGPGNCGSSTLCAEVQTWLAGATGGQEFFYSGAAAWANMVTTTRHDGVKGGLPMQTEDPTFIGTWSDKFPVYLHRLPSVAQKHGWPFVIEGVYDPARRPPVVVFVGAGGRFEDNVLRQPLYAANEKPRTIPIWCPRVPLEAFYDEAELKLQYDAAGKTARVTIPAGSKPGVLTVRFE